jgi:hypothetical protein
MLMSGAIRPCVFDPAQWHFSRAFRPGDPAYGKAEDAAAWLSARRREIGHVLRYLVESSWGSDLVLRSRRTWK